jgi:hypothetical protein
MSKRQAVTSREIISFPNYVSRKSQAGAMESMTLFNSLRNMDFTLTATFGGWLYRFHRFAKMWLPKKAKLQNQEGVGACAATPRPT